MVRITPSRRQRNVIVITQFYSLFIYKYRNTRQMLYTIPVTSEKQII